MKIHPILSIKAHYQTYMLKFFEYTPYGRYMKRIHNSHIGESCFIIGNGPSLSANDLTTLHKNNIDSFAVNRIFKIFSQTEWKPTYYVNTDHVLIRDILDVINDLPIKHKFIPLKNKYYHDIYVKKAHYFSLNDDPSKRPKEIFSLDCTKQINRRGTVTIACIQLAAHMGYKNIYLLGVDHNFDKVITDKGEILIDNSIKNYFCDGYDDDVANEVVHNLGVTTKSYMDVYDFYSKTDVNIFNATRKTKLEVFKKLTFEEAVGRINERK